MPLQPATTGVRLQHATTGMPLQPATTGVRLQQATVAAGNDGGCRCNRQIEDELNQTKTALQFLQNVHLQLQVQHAQLSTSKRDEQPASAAAELRVLPPCCNASCRVAARRGTLQRRTPFATRRAALGLAVAPGAARDGRGDAEAAARAEGACQLARGDGAHLSSRYVANPAPQFSHPCSVTTCTYFLIT
jgi:hypothetical protein